MSGPLSRRMAVIAFCSQNLASATVYGSFGVLLAGVEARYGVSRQGSSLALPLMSASLAVSAPIAGALVERVSARLLMMVGSLLGALAFAILAVNGSHLVYLAVYALLLGPAICLCMAIVPSTLMTRWFAQGRGRALGFMHMPLLMGPFAMTCAFLLRDHGLPTVYAIMAGMWTANLLITSFVIDRPAGGGYPDATEAGRQLADQAPVDGTGRILSSAPFWLLTFAYAANIATSVTMGAHLVPMVTGWGIAPTLAAGVVMATSLAGIAGTPAMGWVMDRIGARDTIALMCINSAVLWALFLLQPPYPVLIGIAVLLGFHSAATTAIFAGAVSEFFGRQVFARTFGLSKMSTLPVTLLAVPAAAMIYVRTGSYVLAVELQAALLFAAGALVFLGCRRRNPEAAAMDVG